MTDRSRDLLQALTSRLERKFADLQQIRTGDRQASAFAGFGAGTTLAGPRRLLLNPASIRLADQVTVLPASVLEALDPTQVVISIGRGSYLGYGVRIVALNGVHLGEQVAIGHGATLSDTIHDHRSMDPGAPPWQAALKVGRPMRIGALSWIGNGCVIAGGLTIGERVIIGANSAVTRDVPDRTLVVGNPARAVRRMDPDGSWHWLVDPRELELDGIPGLPGVVLPEVP